MAIRIRVYPQPGSIGARRNRQRRAQQRRLNQQRAQIRMQQQQLLRQQQMQVSMSGGYGSPFGYSTGLGFAAGFGSPVGYGSFVPGAYSSVYSPAQYNSVSQFSYGSPMQMSAFGYGTSPYLGAGYVAGSHFDPC